MRIPNGRLLMVGDQGYGDTIQFARYIPLIADRCQELILGCSAEMGPLLQGVPGVAQYCHRWIDVPGHAAHCRLSSCPDCFTRRSRRSRPRCLTCSRTRPASKPGDNAWTQSCRRACAGSASPGPGAPRIRTTAGGRFHWRAWRHWPPRGPPASSRCRSRCRRLMPAALAQFPGLVDYSPDLTDFGETAAADCQSRSGDHSRYRDGPSGRRNGQAGLDHAAEGERLALAARAQRQSVVSDSAPVPSGDAGRLGPGHRIRSPLRSARNCVRAAQGIAAD